MFIYVVQQIHRVVYLATLKTPELPRFQEIAGHAGSPGHRATMTQRTGLVQGNLNHIYTYTVLYIERERYCII